MLIENGADVNNRGCSYKIYVPGLKWASRYKRLENIKILIENGANINMNRDDINGGFARVLVI